MADIECRRGLWPRSLRVSMALKYVEMRGAAEGARIRAPNAAGGHVYDRRHPETRIEANAIERYWFYTDLVY